MSKILSKSNLIRSSLVDQSTNDSEDEDPVEQVRRFKMQEKQDNRAKRVESRGNEKRQHKSSSSSNKSSSGAVDLTAGSDDEQEADDGDDDSSSGEDSEGNRWRDDIGKGELQEQANKILKNCDNVSVNLRKSIRAWHGDESASSAKDCVDLMTINEKKGDRSGGDQVLHDEDISVLCPGLQLKAYQLVGVNWMKLLHENLVNGVLADDMGLGKTVQTIAFLGYLKSSSGGRKLRPHLIVVPASTLANWQNELIRFCPSFRVVTYHGSQTERNKLRYELKT
eukprot:gene24382-30723_t